MHSIFAVFIFLLRECQKVGALSDFFFARRLALCKPEGPSALMSTTWSFHSEHTLGCEGVKQIIQHRHLQNNHIQLFTFIA